MPDPRPRPGWAYTGSRAAGRAQPGQPCTAPVPGAFWTEACPPGRGPGRVAVPTARSTSWAIGRARRASSCSEASPTSWLGSPNSRATWNTLVNSSCHSGRASTRTRQSPPRPASGPSRCPSGSAAADQPGPSAASWSAPADHPAAAAAMPRGPTPWGSAAKCSASMATTASAAPSARPVAARSPTTNRARSASPNNTARSVACWTATAEKSTPDQPGAARLGQPQPRTAPAAAQVDQCRPRREAESVGHMTQQADRDKGVRLDLLWQVGAGGLPDSPQARGSGHGGELLVELGGRGRWRLVAGGRAAVLVLGHPSSSRRSAPKSELASLADSLPCKPLQR